MNARVPARRLRGAMAAAAAPAPASETSTPPLARRRPMRPPSTRTACSNASSSSHLAPHRAGFATSLPAATAREHPPPTLARRFSNSAPLSAKKSKKQRSPEASAPSSSPSTTAPSASPKVSPSRYPPLPPGWQAVIGVECHAQIKDRHKLFSTAQLPSANSVPNTLVAPFDAAHPATLPSLNRSALRLAIRAAIALGCHLRQESRFDRKHYFYSDLPAGYQITQKYAPLASNGRITLSFEDGHLPGPEDEVVVEVEQLQLEQDTAKSTYYDTGTVSRSDAATVEDGTDAATARGTSRSFVDLNRAGTGLMEIVSGPQMRSPEQAGAYVRKLQELLRRVGASDGNMQEGSLRCDVNVSVNRAGEPFGTRCEVKNLNSVRFMMNAIAHETQRQVAILEQGGRIEQETRGYDEARGTTFKLRGKEDAPDYRYMPDPNLPPIRLTEAQVDDVRRSLPELPEARRARLKSQYALNTRDINVLMRVGSEDEGSGRFPTPSGVAPTAVECGDAVDYFERIAQGRDPQIAVNWIIHELMKGLNTHNLAFSEDHIPPAQLGELIDLVESGKVTGTTAKSLLGELISSRARSVGEATSSDAPASDLAGVDIGTLSIFDLLSSRGLLALGSRDDLLPLCRQAIEELKQEAEKVRKGNLKVAMRIVGQVMKMAKGRADAKVVHEVILEELGHRIGDQN